jgi:hypothetical protein
MSCRTFRESSWYLFPLRPRSKVPATPNGFKDAVAQSARASEFEGYNVGLRTGAESGIVVLDVDKKHGGLESLHTLLDAHGYDWAETLAVVTGGGGRHFYFQHPGHPVRNRAGILPGIDIRGDGGYVVAPPSLHESGEAYRYVNEDAPIQVMPGWLVDLLGPRDAQAVPGRAEVVSGSEKGELAKSTLKFILEGAAPGTWHAQFYKAAMDLKQNNYEFEEALEKLESGGLELDDTHDIPQLEDVYANREPKHPPRLQETSELVVRASSLVTPMLEYISDKDKVRGEPTGLASLDRLLGGGKRLGELTAYCAEAKTGKNTFWHFLMHKWLERRIPVGYASRELTPESEVLPNLLSIHFEENAWMAELSPERRAAYGEVVGSWPLYFARGYGYFPLDSFKAWVDALQKLGVHYFWVDHLHYCLEDSEEFKEAVTFARELKTLTKTHNIHIDLVVQPTKIVEGMKLGLNTMRGGAGIGQAIDNLFIMERLRGPQFPKNITKLTLDVARSKLCEPGTIYLEYNKQTTRFEEVALIEEELEPSPPTAFQRGFEDKRIR